ncbi:hypothetical protein niasHT_028848 [Heterodera trifolii]|uniref:BTB domain-containing protein n=1 Tax=Heterodera trifolii TaxID=157864 RepID=A0ABD2KQP6_9BILA
MASSKPSNLADRMKHLLDTAKLADAYFLVGGGKELLSAHKIILVSASEVFEAMFRFDSQNGKAENEVPDVEAAAFKVMLSFIYADDLSELNGDNAMAVLCAADKYGIEGLVSHCVQIPIQNLPNVFLAHAKARLFSLEDFAHQCLRYICQNAGELFKSEEFLQIDQNFLCEIFGRDQLEINDEFETWQAALRWADEKCRQNAIECSAENRREALGPALFKIRFPLIPTRDFTKSIVPSNVLITEEMFGIYQFHCHPNLRGVSGLKPLEFPWNGRISDWNTAKGNRGTLAMEIEKLSEFAQEKVETSRFSDAVQIMGMPWKIWAKINAEKDSTEKCLGFYLLCSAPKNDGNWSCECSAILRIVSQKNGTEDLTKKYDHVFNKESDSWGWFNFITLTKLMDPDKGFYEKEKDKVTLAIDFTVEEKGTKRKLTDN